MVLFHIQRSLDLDCTDLQDRPAVPDALLGPDGDDLLGAAASCAIVQPAQDPVSHRGCQQGRRGRACQVLLRERLRLHGTRPERGVSLVFRSGTEHWINSQGSTDSCRCRVMLETLIWIILHSFTITWERTQVGLKRAGKLV